MLTEDYVSFEMAKLLKENGFDASCTHVYNIESGKNLESDFYTCKYVYNSWLDKNEPRLIAAPTLQLAMKWLREVHNIFIGINTVIGSDKNWGYEVFIQKQEIPIPSRVQWDWFNTYEEACEAAIKYCLENLI